MVGIVIEGTVRHFLDYDWERLLRGELDSQTDVLRYIIKKHAAEIAQLQDELIYGDDLRASTSELLGEAYARIAELEKEQVLGWETKPAKAKRLAKEARA